MNKIYWKDYWADKTDGQHRRQDEDFMENEAKEKLFLLEGGKSILDFGCGAAELLTYYSRVYDFNVGADFSASMLKSAAKRLEQFNSIDKVRLLHADDSQVWRQIEKDLGEVYKFDRITAGQVIQYLDKKQIEMFICNALPHLAANGRLCFFDVVDSRTYELWRSKLFKSPNFNMSVLFRLMVGRLRALGKTIKGTNVSEMGYMYPPFFFESLANKYGLKLHVVNSMYYEYRYHVILSC